MLNLFKHWLSTSNSYPRVVLNPQSKPIPLIESSRCFGITLARDNSMLHRVRISIADMDNYRHLYRISQMRVYPIPEGIIYQEDFLGSLEVSFESQKTWLRWQNYMKEISLDELADLLCFFENANHPLARDIMPVLRDLSARRVTL
jgi:hypothetical protein